MRIQHNIAAMNAYRNYNNNTSALGKNLEKLSSGYKINRAGDDAAGLAISEKMRAQITGLNAAQKNVKDGVSLVKTAEGAMQEIQDMLNRMDYLATQSANGTYQNEVDRENLQKEVAALKTEINRIADSANFNGIKLLNGERQATTTRAITNTTPLAESMVNGTNPSAAGTACINVTLADPGQTGATEMAATGSTNGTAVSAGTPGTITIQVGGMVDDGSSTITYSGTVGGTALTAGASSFDSSGTSTWQTGDKLEITGKDGNTYKYSFDDLDGYTKCADMTAVLAALAKDGFEVDNSTANATTVDVAKADITGAFAAGEKIEVGTTTVAQLGDLHLATGNGKLSDYFDITVKDKDNTAKGSSATIENGDTIELVAKNGGSLSGTGFETDLVTNLNSTLTGTNVDSSSELTVTGANEGMPSSAATVTKYELTFDMGNLRAGQTFEIDGKTYEITNGGSPQTGNVALDFSGVSDTDGDGTILDEMAAKFQNVLTNATNGKFVASDFDAASDVDVGANTFTLTFTGKTAAALDDTNLGDVRIAQSATTTAGITATYTEASPAASSTNTSPFATVTYQDAKLSASLTEGSTISIGGKTVTVVASGTTTLKAGEVAEGSITDASLAAAFETVGVDRGKVTFDLANKKMTITGTDVGQTGDALKTAIGKVEIFDKSTAAVTVASGNGMSVTAGVTTIGDLKEFAMPGAATGVKVGDLFNVKVFDKDGNEVSGGDTATIGEGATIQFTAKNAGKLESSAMSAFDFTSGVASITKQEGWDEGSAATGDKTRYDLSIDLSKLKGGQTFTFGNETGRGYTFDLSLDPNEANNGDIGDDAASDVSGNAGAIAINLFDKQGDLDAMGAAIAAAISSSGMVGTAGDKFTLDWKMNGNTLELHLEANSEGMDNNLGDLRVTSNDPNSSVFTKMVYSPAGGTIGGTKGTFAQVSYDFDISKLQDGDQLTVGSGSNAGTVYIGTETKTVSDGNGGAKVYLSEADAHDPTKLAHALDAAGYQGGRVTFEDGKMTITGKTTGQTAEALSKDGAVVKLTAKAGSADISGGLTLQIGDTAESFNQMTVSIGDMHVDAMGAGKDADGNVSTMTIDNIDISTQEGAQKAVQVIKNAINYVSSVRGDLGATQNRLEHTANNLSVMAENITDAESTIRDTDVAEEMMSYVKNNILVQSAQAMLAQANQLPQGVLQLLG